MFNYKIQLKGKELPHGDEEFLVIFLKMLDFSAEFLTTKYDKEKISFYPEEKKIVINDLKKYDKSLEEIAISYGFILQIQ